MADDSKKSNDPDRVPEFYANSVSLAMSAFDATLTFGVQDLSKIDQTKPVVPGVVLPTKTIAMVRMSPQLALILSKVLSRSVEQYEAQNGKIPVQSELLKQLGILDNKTLQ